MQNKQKGGRPSGAKSAAAMLICGVLSLIFYFILTQLQSLSPLLCLLYAALFLAFTGGAYLFFSKHSRSGEKEQFGRSLGQIMLEIVIKMHLPMVICDTTGKIIWRNRAFGAATEAVGSVMGADIGTISSIDVEELDEKTELEADLCERRYAVSPFRFKTDEKSYWFIVFSDKTAYNRLAAQVENERGVVAYIIVDNLDELAQHVQDTYHGEGGDIAKILRDFAASLGGILKEYDRSKYILIMNREGLEKCIANRFDILDRVREVRVGEMGLPITISMGITDVGDTLRAREAAAREALGMALARGGDQVAYKTESALEFFGGNTRPVQKRSSVAAKVRSNELVARISRAGSVLIMGHSGADQDCFGAAVGIARLSMFCYVQPYIVVDKNDRNTLNFMRKFEHLDEYAGVFVDANEAQDMIRTDTLLIVVDVNNTNHMLSPGIALTVEDAVVIDHHRKTEDTSKRAWLAEYIEPSASSASELVAEILEQSISDGMLQKEEADALLGGILLDTKQFTKATGTRTFNAAIYLRSAGASVYEAAKELKSDLGEFKKQSKILSDLVIYRSRFAIAKDEDDGEPTDRIAAAKAAEAMLGIGGVDAAFALCRIGGETHISARSGPGVSVQLILEKMGGGGHLDSAGAKSADPMLIVLERLKTAIDEYLEENSETR